MYFLCLLFGIFGTLFFLGWTARSQFIVFENMRRSCSQTLLHRSQLQHQLFDISTVFIQKVSHTSEHCCWIGSSAEMCRPVERKSLPSYADNNSYSMDCIDHEEKWWRHVKKSASTVLKLKVKRERLSWVRSERNIGIGSTECSSSIHRGMRLLVNSMQNGIFSYLLVST